MGHPTAIFLSPPDPNYKCAICLDIFEDPVSLLQCGHTFCRSCLDSSLCQSGRNCPECRAEIDVGDDDDDDEGDFFGSSGGNGNGNVIHPVRVIQSAIGNSLVRCGNCLDENGELPSPAAAFTTADNDGNGNSGNDDSQPSSSSGGLMCCNWTGPLAQYPLHAATSCPIAMTSCPIPGCSHACPRSQLPSHIGSPSCVEAAVLSQVESQVNSALVKLKRQMKREMERQVKELKCEKCVLEERVQCEMEQRLELQDVNVGLRREMKGLKKVVRSMEQTMHNQQQHMVAKKKKRKCNHSNSASATAVADTATDTVGTLVSPTSSVDGMESASTMADDGESNSKRKKRKKKSRKRQQRQQEEVRQEGDMTGRMRVVLTDST